MLKFYSDDSDGWYNFKVFLNFIGALFWLIIVGGIIVFFFGFNPSTLLGGCWIIFAQIGLSINEMR